MKTPTIFRNSILFLLGATFFVSCIENNDEPFELTPEVICFKTKVNDTMRYALAFYAYANYSIDSAKVAYPGTSGSPVILTPYAETKNTYAKQAGLNDFSKNVPVNGMYSFTVYKGGKIYTENDSLATNNLILPNITGTSYSASTSTLSINWAKVDGAQNYFVRLYNQNKELVYTGYTIHPDSTHYGIKPIDQGWEKSPVTGTTYTLQLNALTYEPNVSQSDLLYHLNSIVFTETPVLWGTSVP